MHTESVRSLGQKGQNTANRGGEGPLNYQNDFAINVGLQVYSSISAPLPL